ncbi:MAG: hypothetical protein ABGW74_04945 [Campylobacterales bacterium]
MKNILVSVVASLVLVSGLNAETTCEAVSTVNTSIESLNDTVTNQQALVSKLSDDIGVMADRIGDMADKIVVTEKLLSDTLIVLTGNASLGSSSTTSGVVLTQPLDNTVASKTTPPTITISTDSSKYLLYASTTPTFDDGKTISLYIESDTSLKTSWPEVVDFASNNSDTIYIAVKSIDVNNKISSLSNGVKLNLE